MSSDSLVLVRGAARGGFRDAGVAVRFRGEVVTVTDAMIDSAELETRPPDGLGPAELKGYLAARYVANLDEEEVARVKSLSREGHEAASRIYQAIVLACLCRMRRLARQIAARVVVGDEDARRKAELVFEAALRPDNPLRLRARVGAALLRDAILELEQRDDAEDEVSPEDENEPGEDHQEVEHSIERSSESELPPSPRSYRSCDDELSWCDASLCSPRGEECAA